MLLYACHVSRNALVSVKRNGMFLGGDGTTHNALSLNFKPFFKSMCIYAYVCTYVYSGMCVVGVGRGKPQLSTSFEIVSVIGLKLTD